MGNAVADVGVSRIGGRVAFGKPGRGQCEPGGDLHAVPGKSVTPDSSGSRWPSAAQDHRPRPGSWTLSGLALLGLVLPGLAAAQPSVLPARAGVLWASPTGREVSGTLLLACTIGGQGCTPDSVATRVGGGGRYTVFKWTPPSTSPVLLLAWRDVNRNAQIDAGDELTRFGTSAREVQLQPYDGNWRAFLGADMLDEFYSSDTGGSVPPAGPFPALARLPVTPGPAQPSSVGARGSLNGSWVLERAYPQPLPPGRSWSDPRSIVRDAAWPLQVLGFQDRVQGRYLYTTDLPAPVSAGCRNSVQGLKLDGQFTLNGETLSFRDTAKALTTTCVKAANPEPVTDQVRSTCATATATLPADQKAATYAQCLGALSAGGGVSSSTRKLPLETHTYKARRYDLQLTDNPRDPENYLLFLEDAQGHVYLYIKS